MGVEITKITQLRNNEYYCMQELFDFLYKQSKMNYIFYDLISHIMEDNNKYIAILIDTLNLR